VFPEGRENSLQKAGVQKARLFGKGNKGKTRCGSEILVRQSSSAVSSCAVVQNTGHCFVILDK